VPDVGDYRHLYATRRKALEQRAREPGPTSYIRHRRWSASLGHGQSGGWSIYLPNRFEDEVKALQALDARWPPLSPGRSLLLQPPSVGTRPRRISQPARRRRDALGAESDWASQGLDLPSIEVDRMPAAHARLWRFEWADRLQLDRKAALTIALLIQLAGFSELLVPIAILRDLEWSDLELTGDGRTMSLQLPNTLGKLRVCLGAAEALLFQQLHHMRPPRPFAEVDQDRVSAVLQDIFGVPVSVDELQRGNQLLHLLSHDTEQIGYLLGRAGHKVRSIIESRPPRTREHHQHTLAPLISDLRCDARLSLRELDSRLDRLFSDWHSWPVDKAGIMTPAIAVAALRTCCSTPSRRDPRRSRSASESTPPFMGSLLASWARSICRCSSGNDAVKAAPEPRCTG